MSDKHTDDELAAKLADLVNEDDDDTRHDSLADTISVARDYLAPHIKGYTISDSVLDDIVLGVAADLWQARDARNGVMNMVGDVIEPFRISSDPLRSAWAKLRAVGIPAGLGIA